MDSNNFASAPKEGSNTLASSHVNHLERLHTAGGHVDDRSQPSLPVYHRKFASPSPLGLISFATGK
jgi:succinate-acetate transporter protein